MVVWDPPTAGEGERGRGEGGGVTGDGTVLREVMAAVVVVVAVGVEAVEVLEVVLGVAVVVVVVVVVVLVVVRTTHAACGRVWNGICSGSRLPWHGQFCFEDVSAHASISSVRISVPPPQTLPSVLFHLLHVYV
jgi:hypothetical protein